MRSPCCRRAPELGESERRRAIVEVVSYSHRHVACGVDRRHAQAAVAGRADTRGKRVCRFRRHLGTFGHPTLKSVFSRDDERLFVVYPYQCRRLIYLFDFEAVKLPIEWNGECLFAGSENEGHPALIASHYPNSNGGIVHRRRPCSIPRILNHQGTQPER
jgi:hypothetical protein